MPSLIPQPEVVEFHKSLSSHLISSPSAVPASLSSLITSQPLLAALADEITGTTPLILCHSNIIYTNFFLSKGAPWNALDRSNKSAGNYASDSGSQAVVDALVAHATRSEMLLGQVFRNLGGANAAPSVVDAGESNEVGKQMCTKGDYLGRAVRYEGDVLLDDDDDAVMMEWERPLMSLHAQVICREGGRVMNVGFGMGIIDGFLQGRKPGHHTIIEAHPGVLRKMKEDGWMDRPNVTVLEGRWQDVISSVPSGSLDGVFFDTYGENHTDLEDFHSLLPRVMSQGGTYSFFNGLCPDNIFFHGVACNVVKLGLEALGFEVEFAPCEIQVRACESRSDKMRKHIL